VRKIGSVYMSEDWKRMATRMNRTSISIVRSESLSFSCNYENIFFTVLLIVILTVSAIVRQKCASNLYILKSCLKAAADMPFAVATLALNLPYIVRCGVRSAP
jgi:hypothetical protein